MNRIPPSAVLLRNHGLAIELSIDRAHPVGGADRAGIADVVLESALTTIVDLEDSVATVDGADKVVAYRNWLGLMRGDLTEQVTKGGRTFSRSLAPNRKWKRPSGTPLELPRPRSAPCPQRRASGDDPSSSRRRGIARYPRE